MGVGSPPCRPTQARACRARQAAAAELFRVGPAIQPQSHGPLRRRAGGNQGPGWGEELGRGGGPHRVVAACLDQAVASVRTPTRGQPRHTGVEGRLSPTGGCAYFTWAGKRAPAIRGSQVR